MNQIKSKLDTVLAMMFANGGGDVSFKIINSNVTSEVSSTPLDSGESVDIVVPFANTGILQTVYIKTVEEDLPFTVKIKNASSDGITEYKSIDNKKYCYDVIDIIYIDSEEQKSLYLTLTNDSDSPINFDFIRIRGIEI